MIQERPLDFSCRDLVSTGHDEIVDASDVHERSVGASRTHVAGQRPSLANGRCLRVGIAPVARAGWSPNREQTRNAGGELAKVIADNARVVAGDDVPDDARAHGSGPRGNEDVRQLGGSQAVQDFEARARELLNAFVRSLASRGITAEAYFQTTGQTPEALTAQVRAEAAQSVARELALEAVAEQAAITVTDDEVKALIREQADASGDDADEVIEDIWAHGHQEQLREDLRLRAALDRLAADVKPIAPETHAAREAIWTPDKEKPAGETKLWTPGSEEQR